MHILWILFITHDIPILAIASIKIHFYGMPLSAFVACGLAVVVSFILPIVLSREVAVFTVDNVVATVVLPDDY